jgi:hypothetical protein
MRIPQDVIWYVRCELTDNRMLEGSAVAIKLCPTHPEKNGGLAKAEPRTFLLTCTHVLRKSHDDRSEGAGSLVDPSWIRVWPPGVGLSDSQSCKVRIVREIQDPDPRPLPEADRKDLSKDWVVLEILDSNDALRPGIWLEDWHLESLERTNHRLWPIRAEVSGYPGGLAGLEQGITQATTSGPFLFRSETEGAVVLTGSDTRPGMSGGGVFGIPYLFGAVRSLNAKPRWIGLHRARSDQTLQCRSISAKLIHERFSNPEVPWDLASRKLSPTTEHFSAIRWLVGLLLPLLLVAGWFGFNHRRAQRLLDAAVQVHVTLKGEPIDLSKEVLLGVPPLVVVDGAPQGAEIQWTGTAEREANQKQNERFVSTLKSGEQEVTVTVRSGWCQTQRRLVVRFTDVPWEPLGSGELEKSP